MELDYCCPRGIPHSKFLRWDEDDQDKAIAWAIDQRKRCDKCGTYPEDWIDPETKIPYYPPPMYVHSIRCIGCANLENDAEEVRKAHEGDSKGAAGIRFFLAPEPPVVESYDDDDDGEEEEQGYP